MPGTHPVVDLRQLSLTSASGKRVAGWSRLELVIGTDRSVRRAHVRLTLVTLVHKFEAFPPRPFLCQTSMPIRSVLNLSRESRVFLPTSVRANCRYCPAHGAGISVSLVTASRLAARAEAREKNAGVNRIVPRSHCMLCDFPPHSPTVVGFAPSRGGQLYLPARSMPSDEPGSPSVRPSRARAQGGARGPSTRVQHQFHGETLTSFLP